MKTSLKAMLLAAGVLTAGSASAQITADKVAIKGVAQTYMTYTTAAQITTSKTSGYNGVGSLFVQTASSAATGSGFLCTGSLVNSTTVLTAAHCVFPYAETGAPDPVVSIRFYLPSFGERAASTTEIFNASQFAFNSGYDTADHTGDIGSGHDVALFTLTQAATGHDTYGLYTGDPLQQYTEVGTGTIGGPKGTNVGVTSDYLKRTGTNVYEYYGDDVFTDVSHGVALYDFDDGTAAHDVFGSIGGTKQLGVAGESAASPGDSGGPEFINGQIASVTSFGITGGIFNGYCGGNSIDPYNNSGTTTKTTDLSKCTNSSVGEIGGNTLVSYNMDFINSYLNNTASVNFLPEPTTWAEMVLGFGLLGFGMRSRRRKLATA